MTAIPEECVVEPGGIELPTSRCLSSSLAVDRRRDSQRTACSHRKRRQTQARSEPDAQVHRPPGPAATRPAAASGAARRPAPAAVIGEHEATGWGWRHALAVCSRLERCRQISSQ